MVHAHHFLETAVLSGVLREEDTECITAFIKLNTSMLFSFFFIDIILACSFVVLRSIFVPIFERLLHYTQNLSRLGPASGGGLPFWGTLLIDVELAEDNEVEFVS